ncbi:PepSY domain-containing protein [Pseudomaricurvus sp. HS19]|uniref:PepSY domain-containing protein n=1 Tax=Pseudomaricurvus sp. HS19 TaxID=2692626 RepID=UPI00136F6723|nr:PepSY domain-containing protein [Pseudomaricurvus sp. HS19]MYM63247.1 hypothetical protein [Pseudomaricurvus sp. HS19]
MLRRLRPALWRWHRRIGLFAMAFLLLISVTGILLNHTSSLHLGSQPVRQPWLLALYGLDLPDIRSYQVGEQWLAGDALGQLYLQGEPLSQCNGSLQGAVALGDLVLLACTRELLLLTATGEVVERLDGDFGLPLPLSAAGQCGDRVCLRSQGQAYLVDLEQLQWLPAVDAAVQWGEPGLAPAELRKRLRAHLASPLSWEKVVQDLHSGRLFGSLGVLLFDLLGVLFIFLALSGLWLWYRPGRGRRELDS